MYTFINMCTIKFGFYCYITLKNSILMYTALFYYLHSNAVRLLPPPHFFFRSFVATVYLQSFEYQHI